MPIAVVRAETFYLPPPREPATAWDGVPAAERVFRWVEHRLQRRVIAPTGTVQQTYFARINQNRWVVDCVCGSAQVGSPTDPRFACTECGLGWCTVVYPASPAAVEEALLGLLPHLRNWWHDSDPANPSLPIAPVEEPQP